MSTLELVAPHADDDGAIARSRHPWQAAIGLVLLLSAGWLVATIVDNPQLDLGAIPKYLFDPAILKGLRTTVLISLISMGIGIVLGTVVAVMRLSRIRTARTLSGVYIWIFRGTPQLVQIIFWFNLALVFPRISLGIPGIGTLWSASTNSVMTSFTAAIVALGLNEGAYMAEIVRAGILSVDRGQTEAAQAIGMTPGQTLRRIVLPQAVRVAVPPTGNELIAMFKASALVFVIAGGDLMTNAQLISSQNFQVIELLVVASIWYLVLTTITTVVQRRLELKLSPQMPRRTGRRGLPLRPLAGRWSR